MALTINTNIAQVDRLRRERQADEHHGQRIVTGLNFGERSPRAEQRVTAFHDAGGQASNTAEQRVTSLDENPQEWREARREITGRETPRATETEAAADRDWITDAGRLFGKPAPEPIPAPPAAPENRIIPPRVSPGARMDRKVLAYAALGAGLLITGFAISSKHRQAIMPDGDAAIGNNLREKLPDGASVTIEMSDNPSFFPPARGTAVTASYVLVPTSGAPLPITLRDSDGCTLIVAASGQLEQARVLGDIVGKSCGGKSATASGFVAMTGEVRTASAGEVFTSLAANDDIDLASAATNDKHAINLVRSLLASDNMNKMTVVAITGGTVATIHH